MIVSCGHCTTQFQLDDAKIPAAGARVRCSRCSHTFSVESPQRADGDRAADLARAAFESGPVEDSESDWEFNEEVAAAPSGGLSASRRDAAADAVDDMLGAGFVESRDSFGPGDSDFALGAIADGGAESRFPAPALGDDPLDFSAELAAAGDAEPFDAFGDLGDPAAAEPVEFDRPLASADVGSARAAAPTPLQPDSALELADGDRLGSPAAPAGGARDAAPALESTPAPPRRRSAPPQPTAAPAAREPSLPRLLDDLEPDPEVAAAGLWLGRVRAGAGWAAVLSLCVYAVLVGLLPVGSADSAEESVRSVAGAELHAVRGSWVENADAGPIYVVTGALSAAGADPRAGSKLLRVRMLDVEGRPIAAESAALGPPLPAERLREWSLRDLQDAQEVAARQLARAAFATGERRPFVAVLGKLPADARAFEFSSGGEAAPPFAPPGSETPYPDERMSPRG